MSFKLSETSYLPVGRVRHHLGAQQVEALVSAQGEGGKDGQQLSFSRNMS